ncbi:neuropathy target esterase sws isoform X2 [Cryptotermes secundus]|uniref:neuropathy target esterase sws isoform X2 n=1 Tax=Cryptotermes secundus TaxID=105785 RepID=UPI000CD7B8DD|nr:neuropathy target esterase sws isoform X2 [Cryptotermes secundus]
MEVVKMLSHVNDTIGSLVLSTWLGNFVVNLQDNQGIYLLIIGLFLTVVIGCTLVLARKWKNKEFLPEVKEFVGVGSTRPRFRKRDKVLFYGRKMLRKVKSISGQVHGVQGKKRKMVMRFARRLLQLKKDSTPVQLTVLEPPAEYLEEDVTSKDDQRVPPDALYMLQSIRVFGHFEKPVFLKLCKHTEIMNLPAGSYLFKIGDPDENVYVIQNGKVNVFITGSDGTTISLKCVKTGESVTSLLSFTDVLTGHTNPYKTVCARAIEDSTVVRLPMAAFQEVFQEYPDIFIRVVQVIMVRLQRVTFTALHQYLGLSTELMNPGTQRSKKQSPFAGSPVRSRTRDNIVPKEESGIPIGTSLDMLSGASPSDQVDFLSLVSGMNLPPQTLNRIRSRSCLEMKLPSSQFQPQPDMLPEFDHQQQISPQAPDVQPNVSSSKRRIAAVPESVDEETLIQIATETFVKELGLEDDTVLRGGKVEIREVPAGTYLMKEESHKDVALIYLLSGTLVVSQKIADSGQEVTMFVAHPGEIVGGLAVLTGEPSFFSIRAKHASRIAMLSKNTFYSIMRDRPQVVLHIAHTVVRRLSPFVRQVDFALDWVFVESGRAVYRQGDESDSTFIVLSGRLRSVITHSNGKKELVGEYGKGDLVGIVEMVTQTPRSTTVMAVRDSELAKLPEGLFNAIKLRFPIVVTRLINLLGHRILGSWQQPNIKRTMDAPPSQGNFSTVAIVPISDDVPLTAFTYELYHSLCAISSTLRLTSDVIRKSLGSSILDPNNEYRLTSWLAQQEDQHKIALYQCDMSFTAWTQRCVRQADCILIVGLADKGTGIGKIEKEVERLTIRTHKELVLLHREGADRPKNTVSWLNNRSWVSTHHHIQCSKRMFIRRSQYRINELYMKVLTSEPLIHTDFSRLARWLTGTSVGLVLGGGGARGAAHVGMIKAIQEAGIPIDMVGGVSIGAFMGALWCAEKNVTTMTQKAREWSKKLTQWWRQLLDLTYPVTSMFSGRDFNQTIFSTFGDTHIEDLWLPYFTVTTDITASSMRVHTHGSLWRYIRASMSLSGYMPPLCDPTDGHLLLDGGYVNNLPGSLWRYVRSSMTIAGIFPPFCDPRDGHLLVDGCYVNNVPADVMRSHGAKHILAIDVGSQDDTDLTNYGDCLSGWWLLWKRWNPFASPVKVPNLPDIQSRLAYVSCVRQLEEVKNSDYCEYIRPPIDKYKTLQFGSFDEIKEVGYNHGKTYFAGLLKAGLLPIFKPEQGKASHPHESSCYTFTDLAQMVCKVAHNQYIDESDSEEEYEADEEDAQEVGYASEPAVGLSDTEKTSLRRRRVGGSLSLSENELESENEYATKS